MQSQAGVPAVSTAACLSGACCAPKHAFLSKPVQSQAGVPTFSTAACLCLAASWQPAAKRRRPMRCIPSRRMLVAWRPVREACSLREASSAAVRALRTLASTCTDTGAASLVNQTRTVTKGRRV